MYGKCSRCCEILRKVDVLIINAMTSFIILVTVQLQDTIASTSAYYINNVAVPPNQSLRIVTGGEKLILGPSTNVIVTTSQASSLDLAISYVEIS